MVSLVVEEVVKIVAIHFADASVREAGGRELPCAKIS